MTITPEEIAANVIAFKTGDGTAEFDCLECGTRVMSFCHVDEKPICALCRHLPGWRQDAHGKLVPPERAREQS